MKNCVERIILICFIVRSVKSVPFKYIRDSTKTNYRMEKIAVSDSEILLYEEEHQKFYKKEIKDGDHLEWPALKNKSLYNYCLEFLSNCGIREPTVYINGVESRKTLHYENTNANATNEVIVVLCKVMYKNHPRSFYMTRAPESNCVYSLKCTRKWAQCIFTINNKYCNTENNLSTSTSQKQKWKEILSTLHHLTEQPIAREKCLLEYELEHQVMASKELEKGDHLKWPAINDKNLHNYCTEFLYNCGIRKTTFNLNSAYSRKILHYEKHKASAAIQIIVVLCKVMYKSRPLSYYMTRAPEPDCVYSLKTARKRTLFIFTINNKCCNFEYNLPKKSSPKRKRKEVLSTLHHSTGQRIAKNKFLLEYELEHQEMCKKEAKDGAHIEWPSAIVLYNIDHYCNQYIKKCVPNRTYKGVSGSWKTDKLHYHELNTNEDIGISVVTCLAFNGSQWKYHMTRAPDTNCVYALYHKLLKKRATLVIAFKHCNFENVKEYVVPEPNVIPKIEIKDEIIDTLETLQLLKKN